MILTIRLNANHDCCRQMNDNNYSSSTVAQPDFCFGWGTSTTPSLSLFYHFPPSLPLSFFLPILPSHYLSPTWGLYSLIQLRAMREHCKLPQRIRAESGRQTDSGAF